MYGTQTDVSQYIDPSEFENDVKMYGTQTEVVYRDCLDMFENDVKMYGTQTIEQAMSVCLGLRMM